MLRTGRGCCGQTDIPGTKQGTQAQQELAGTGRDPRRGLHSRRRSVTCSRPALGMGMPPCSSAGTRGVSWAGPWVGVPAGRSGTSGSLPSSATAAPSVSVRAAPLGPPALRGTQLWGWDSGIPGEERGTGRAAPDPPVGSCSPRPAQPLCVGETKRSLCRARTRADCAGTVPGKSRRDKAAVAHGHGTGRGTRWWQSPWWWHTAGAQGWASPPSRQPGDSGAGTETPSPKGTGMLWGVPAAVELQDIARTPAGHQPSATGSATS